MHRYWGQALRALSAALVLVSTARAQDAPVTPPTFTALPQEHVFRPLLADPKTPRFDTSLLRASSDLRSTTAWAVVFGENFGLAEWQTSVGRLQVGVAGAVFAQFDLDTPSADLINADYVIGLPLSYRSGPVSAQIRLYHQSSHLGDEFLLHTRPQRINLSVESLEWLVSYDWSEWRVYGGGEYLVRRQPAELRPRMAQGGAEFRRRAPVVQFRGTAVGRLVAAVDVQWWELHDWGAAWSAKAGLEFSPAGGAVGSSRRWGILLQYYNGPSPYGQFLGQEIKYVGAGVQFVF